MGKYIEIIQDSYARVWQKPYFFVFMLAAIVLLLVQKKSDRRKRLLAVYSMITLAAIFVPLFCALVAKFLRDGVVYWRLFWLVPSAVLIAWLGVEVIFRSQKKHLQVLTAAAVVAAIAFGGKTLFRSGAYTERTNWEKIPFRTELTMNIINDNAKAKGNPYKRLAAPVEIVCQIRQLDATILQYGGRKLHPEKVDGHKYHGYYYSVMYGLNKDYDHRMVRILRSFETNYVAFPTEYGLSADLKKAGAECLYNQDGWEIWYLPEIINSKHPDEYFWMEEN